MKVFIIYASAGQGHKKAAEVLYAHLKVKAKDDDIRLIDALDYSNGFVRWAYTSGYDFVIRHCQWLWSWIFFASGLRLPFDLNRHFHSLSNWLNSAPLYALLKRERPDIVINTHFMPSQIASWLKCRGELSCRLVTVVTDFGVHPFWYTCATDVYAAGSETTRRQLAALGVPAEKIAVTGIPVAPSLTVPRGREELRAELGLPQGVFTVLLVTGSFGIGPLQEIAEKLHSTCRVLIVCARNKKLQARLEARKMDNVSVYGFVRNLDQLMAASDIVVTKPGGLSISELLALNAVPVFICAIPGQEAGNVAALAAAGINTYCRDPEEVRRTVTDFHDHPEKLQQLRALIRQLRKPRSTEEITDAIRSCCAWPAG